MGSLSDYAEKELLDHVFNVAYPTGGAVYLALCTADPTDAGTGASMSECADAFAYARTLISFGVPASRVTTQDAAVTFPQASGGGWGTVSHWAVLDGNTHGAGNMLAHGAFTASKTINDGNTPEVASGEINVTFSVGEVSDTLALDLLGLMFDATAYAKPATWVALIITNPVTDGMTGSTITEPSGGAYARKQVNINGGGSPTWDIAAGVLGLVDNTHEIAFVQATAAWGTVIAVAICSAVSAGDLLFYDNTMADQAVNDGDTAKFAIGVLDITMD